MNIFYPVQLFADWITYKLLSIKPGTKLAEGLNFFIFDSIKIFILLSVIIFVVSIIRTYFRPEKVRKFLAKKHRFIGHLLAGLLGILTPFCSCSAIPLFLGFVEAGVPLGITFTFLIASPMINEVALILLLGMFGLKAAIAYIASGLVIAILSGVIIGKLKPEKLLEEFVLNIKSDGDFEEAQTNFKDRIDYAKTYTKDIITRVYPYVLIGISVGAFIHGYIPDDFLVKYAGRKSWYAVPLAVLIGIPLYSNAAGTIPIVHALTEKGVSIGTALAFMMAVTALSLPELMILKRVMKIKLITIFTSVVGIGILFTGYLFNFILK